MKLLMFCAFLLKTSILFAQTQCLNPQTVMVYFENMWFDYNDLNPANYEWSDVTACVEIDWEEILCVPEEVEWFWMMETDGQRVAITAPGTNEPCVTRRIYGTTSFWVCITSHQEGSSLEEFPVTARTKTTPCNQSSIVQENNHLKALMKKLQNYIKQVTFVNGEAVLN